MTKKTIFLVTLVVFLGTTTTNYAGNSIDAKIGAASTEVSKLNTNEKKTVVGFDGSVAFNWQLDKLFALAPEIGLFRYQDKQSSSGVTLEQTSYFFPMLLNAKLFLPLGDSEYEKPLLQPYLTVGIGYVLGTGSGKVSISGFSADVEVEASGLTYQALLGTAITLDPTSAVQVLLEGGYRGMDVTIKNTSGGSTSPSKEESYRNFIVRVGIRYSLGVTSSY